MTEQNQNPNYKTNKETMQVNNQLVFIENGRIVTDSLTVAEVFGKRHNNVVRDIEQLECSEEFSLLNFEQSDYTNERGKTYKKYFITQGGFTFLVMGYIGKEAARFKEAYIAEFERMREQLQAQLGIPSYMIDDRVGRAQKWIEEEQVRIELKQKVIEYAPKISYLETILNSKGTVTITQIAKDYGMSGQLLNRVLHDEGVQFRVNGQWLLYRKHDGNGYVDSITPLLDNENVRTFTTMTTRWTQKGRLFIHEILKQRGVVPVMEREQVAN